uniref:WD repeat domain 41 n=1 Tax=Molossus molossus TaxID=27622 RepID=A0A7J8J5T1_MOLMO|nr:WD repeat domain 41 [Molossus molossus]
MLRWLIGGGREPQGLAEKSPLQTIGEEQTQNPYTELLVLKAHHDIVRFLVRLDDCRFASAGDDGLVVIWNAQTGEKLLELNGHTQKITAITTIPSLEACEEKNQLILTASADRTVIISLNLEESEIAVLWNCDSGRQVQKISCFQSTVKVGSTHRRITGMGYS